MSTKERIKSVLIGVLIVGVLYLTYSVWFYNSPFGELRLDRFFNFSSGGVVSDTGSDDADLNRFGIRPMSIVLRDEAGARGAIYNSAETDAIYSELRDVLKKAVSGAKKGASANEKAWQEAIISSGVLCDYFGDVPINAVANWMTGNYRDELSESGRYLLFSTEGKYITLYIKNGETGAVTIHETGVSSKSLLDAMGDVSAAKVTLAAEREETDFSVVSPELVIAEGRDAPFALNAYDPLSAFAQDITSSVLARFKLSRGVSSTYSEQDGTQVYVADMVTLRISQNGILTYSDTRDKIDDTLGIGIESAGDVPTAAEASYGARKLIEGVATDLPGAGGMYIADVTKTREGYEIIFARHVGGIPIEIAGTAYFARVTTNRASISSVSVNMRSFDVGTASSETMSERLAAAAMKGSGQSGDLSLRYADTGADTVFTAWYISGEEDADELGES